MALTRWILPMLLLSLAWQRRSRAALKNYFEDARSPSSWCGTESGVDIYQPTKPLDYPRYADRLKQNGTAIRSGQRRW